ncbi:AraC family transcriptional regulator ligand-binding domain-containing protein [Acinetobacter sp. S40]|uniref:helix-turn-helix domain-containing protein n=1 Tax=unclassified Acinetobacter TaxID=196816 RepID=UPI00190A67D0|nr:MULTISPECIES: AraC family transcriptional regulator [unclassified Acinetobacter]MBJ9985722.1 AraC family transcriptional regulator ligand-binding domain-containing protein [Acinetobacter sp. S40]MBK0064122.1 AraC family transcriptional regulator ligand-binding domain-containing protein [Acinetobacter sp. S55]MBK0067369.1 AraC family transcriptional regulator ligand-binding domain-containing protein [Acinetobacter sp. S54]
MKDPFLLNSASIPVSYVLLLLEIMADKNFCTRELVKKSKISPHLLQDSNARVTPKQWSRLVWESLRLAGDTGLGYEYGLRLRLTAHGPMGFALMSCKNLKQAIELTIQFFSMRLRHYQLSFTENIEQCTVIINEVHPVMSKQVEQVFLLRRFFYECLLIGTAQAGKFLSQYSFDDIEITVDWAEPDYHQKFKDYLPNIQFDQPNNLIRYRTPALLTPLPMADSVAYQQALQQCKIEQLRFVKNISDILTKVKAELTLTPYEGYPELDKVAQRMAISSRTLKRNLQQLGTSFSELLDDIKYKEAQALLLNADMEIQQIAVYFGYEQPTNFTRAFKKWSGITPIQYRRNLG